MIQQRYGDTHFENAGWASQHFYNRSIFVQQPKSLTAAGYTTFNLKASHGWALPKGHLTAYARIDNLTNQNYVGSVIVNQSSSQFYEPAPGRNYTLGLRLSMPL